MEQSPKTRCKICNKKFKDTNTLVRHFMREHHYRSKQYYDEFYKSKNDGFCLYCHKPLPYHTLNKGYRKVCFNKKCELKHNQHAGRLASKKIKEKYGVSCPMHVDKFKRKLEQTNLDRYGIKYPISLKSTKEKMEKTNVERYGHKCVFANNKIKKKIKKTILKKYGVVNVMQSQTTRDKIKKTCIEKYGVSYASQNKKIIAKIKKTKIKKYGNLGGFQDKEVMALCIKAQRRKKEASGEWIKKEDTPDFITYKRLVYLYTRRSVNKKYSKNQLKNIGKMGNSNKKQVDHIFSIKEGFDNCIPPWIIGSAVNLRLIHWRKNLLKKTKSEISKKKLFSLFKQHIRNVC